MRVRAEPTVPCNNDLLAENFIEVDGVMRLIDYEYSGNNEPAFELGNIWSESNLSLAQLEELVAHYYGRPLRNKVARARLWGLMSKYGWTLWGSIQDGISDLDFDFWGWAMEKYDRAVERVRRPGVRAAARRRAARGLASAPRRCLTPQVSDTTGSYVSETRAIPQATTTAPATRRPPTGSARNRPARSAVTTTLVSRTAATGAAAARCSASSTRQ